MQSAGSEDVASREQSESVDAPSWRAKLSYTLLGSALAVACMALIGAQSGTIDLGASLSTLGALRPSATHGGQHHSVSFSRDSSNGHEDTGSLEGDMAAAGIAADSLIPCAFSFQSGRRYAPLSFTTEPLWDMQFPASLEQNNLEWMIGVIYAFHLDLAYTWSNMCAWNSEQGFLWQRFLGMREGEETLDDLNARLEEGQTKVVEVNHRTGLVEVRPFIQTYLGDLSDQPQTLFLAKRPQLLDTAQLCHGRVQQIFRQKYCTARAERPMPYSLYSGEGIHIAVALHSALLPGSGTDSTSEGSELLRVLPQSMEEYVDSIGTILAQLIATLRRSTNQKITIHLFPENGALPTPELGGPPHPLRLLETHPTLVAVIQSFSTQGEVSIEGHWKSTQLHAAHHLIMADVVVLGWGVSSLWSSLLNEGLVIVPDLPHQKLVTKLSLPIAEMAQCGEKVARYQISSGGGDWEGKRKVQARRLRELFGNSVQKDEEQSADTASSQTASAKLLSDAGILPQPSKLISSSIQVPVPRIIRRRHAEELHLQTAFEEIPTTEFSPDATLMRHCQVIPDGMAASKIKRN